MNARPFRVLLASLTLIVLSACSSSGGTLPEPTTLNSFEPQLELVNHWSMSVGEGANVGGGSTLKPVLLENAVFAASGKQLTSFSLEAGQVNWSIELEERITAGIGYVNEQLFVASRDGKLMALSSSDGSILWQVNASSEALAVPQANSQIVVLQTVDGKVSAYATEDGKFQWSYAASLPSLTLRGTSTPVINETYTYVGFANGKLVALDNQTGGVVWQKAIATTKGRSETERLADIDGALVLIDGLLYVTSYQGSIAAIDALTGSIIWQQPASSVSGATLVGGAVLIVDAQDVIVAYDKDLGLVLWQNDSLKHRSLSSPMGLDNQVLVVDAQGYAHVLQLKDGDFLGRQKLSIKDARIGSQSYQDTIFLLSQDGRLIRLGLK